MDKIKEAVSKVFKFHAANATRKTTQRHIDSFQIAAFFASLRSLRENTFETASKY